jgi:hypothetical protein
MAVVRWVYHGKIQKQCYYSSNCSVCFIRDVLSILSSARRTRQGRAATIPEPEFVTILEAENEPIERAHE